MAIPNYTTTSPGGSELARGVDLIAQGTALVERAKRRADEDSALAGGNANLEFANSFGCSAGDGATLKTRINAVLTGAGAGQGVQGIYAYLALLDQGLSG